MKVRSSNYWNIIYIYSIPEIESYSGFIKIGLTSLEAISLDKISQEEVNLAAIKRIKEQISTAGLNAKLEFATLAIKNEGGTERLFTDKEFHQVLALNGRWPSLPRHPAADLDTDKIVIHSTGKEWFKINPSDAKKWLEEFKNGKINFTSSCPKIELRKPQVDASTQIQKAYENSMNYSADETSKNSFLLDAIPRFGKCLTTYDFINKCDIKNTLILTHKPIVWTSWQEDFRKIFTNDEDKETYGKNYKFLMKSNDPSIINSNERIVYFASIQDMRGTEEHETDENDVIQEDGFIDEKTIANFKKSNKEIYAKKWDLVIVDEAHEGNLTKCAKQMHSQLTRKFTLYLSGTTFNLRHDEEFEKNFGKNIYVFDQEEETKCRKRWTKENGTDHNPYEHLPEICLNGVSISKENISSGLKKTGYVNNYFDFSLFFQLDDNDEFINKDEIIKWLDTISTDDKEDEFLTKMPFNILNRFSTRHSLWILPKNGVKIAKRLEELLLNHEYFRKKGYSIFNVCGDAWKENSFEKIKECTNDEKKCSITLSIKRLTTGVTIEGWSSVLLLNNSKSPMAYFQTIYRAKSPSPKGWIQQKKYALIFDFNPDRMLSLIFNLAKSKYKKDVPSNDDINKVLNFLNVMSFVDNDFDQIDAGKLKKSLDEIIVRDVVDNGFRSTSLLDQEKIRANGRITPEKLLRLLEKAEEKIRKTDSHSESKKVTDHGLDTKIVESENGTSTADKVDQEITKKKEEEKILKRIRNITNTILTKVPFMLVGKCDEVIKKYPSGLSDFTVEKFCQLFDADEWSEIMEKLEKKDFKEVILEFINQEIFNNSCQEWISRVLQINEIHSFLEKKEKWINLFSYMHNPDSETVLTPWSVVEKHYNHADINWKIALEKKQKFVDINSKSAFYPLYALAKMYEESHEKDKKGTLNKILYGQIYLICKTNLSRNIAIKVLGFKPDTKNVIVMNIPKKLEEEKH